MSSIYIYKGPVDASRLSGVKAMISFVPDSTVTSVANTKHFAPDEARKGLEQLKRWVSVGSFKVILLEGFVNALEKGNTEHIIQWLEDHSTEPGFPNLVLIGDSSSSPVSRLARELSSMDEVLDIINA